MRIAVNGKAFATAQRGGVVRVAAEIVRQVARQRPDFAIDLLVPCVNSIKRPPDMPDNVRLITFESRSYSTGYGRSVWEQFGLPRQVRRGSYDILLNLSNSAPVWMNPGTPQLLLVHDAGFLNREWFSTSYSAYARAVVKKAARTGVQIVTVSKSAADELRVAVPIETPIEVIYNDADQPPAEIPRVELPTPFVLSIGHLNPRKNLDGAIAGFRKFATSTDEPYRLIVVGAAKSIFRSAPGTNEEYQSDDDGLVVFAGYVSDAERWAYYRQASALLFPSHAEGFGLPVLEALRVGTPVVVSDIPVFRELYSDAVERVNPKSAEDIAAGLDRVCHDAKLRERLIRRGSEVASRFSWARSAQRYIELITEIVSANE